MKKIITIMTILGAFATGAEVSFAGYFNNSPVYQCNSQISSNLAFGSENDQVLMLQEFLQRAGYLHANPNGYFGYATQQAVGEFQADNQISQTGVVGSATIDALNERLCDSNVSMDTNSGYNNGYGNSYGNSSDVTYVDPYDPYARVISPIVNQSPVIYQTPQNNLSNSVSVSSVINNLSNTNPVYSNSSYSNNYNTNTNSVYSNSPVINSPVIQSPINYSTNNYPNNVSSLVNGTSVVYNPFIGYTYGIATQPGTLTITSPGQNSVFHEGDQVTVSWTSSNVNANNYTIRLENTSTGNVVNVVANVNNTATFTLTKDLLDSVCLGVCTNQIKNNYAISVNTYIKDIAGNVVPFKASASQITIVRPFTYNSGATLTVSKNPVDSGEGFRLFVDVPAPYIYGNTSASGIYSIKIRAICPTIGVIVNVGGTTNYCNQDFTMSQVTNYLQQSIPISITNNDWLPRSVEFDLTAVDSNGNLVGVSTTTVNVNPIARPF